MSSFPVIHYLFILSNIPLGRNDNRLCSTLRVFNRFNFSKEGGKLRMTLWLASNNINSEQFPYDITIYIYNDICLIDAIHRNNNYNTITIKSYDGVQSLWQPPLRVSRHVIRIIYIALGIANVSCTEIANKENI